MNQLITTDRPGITFAVDSVTPATEPLKECKAHEAMRRLLGGAVESCCDYHGSVVRDVDYQPLLAAVYTAFSEHRPLVLTPDAVWVTIAQGVAHHMLVHRERLRSRFVAHQGKLDLVFSVTDWVEGSPENPWAEAFAGWSAQIREHVGAAVHDALVCDFSTTGPAERAASEIVLMDVFERYFHYVLYGICGIPAVTLEGTPADWERLRDKAAALDVFDMDWWLEHLLPVCEQFVRASRGDIDLEHWRNICKLRSEYGGDIINGWVAKLFPYLRAFINGPCTLRNPIFETGEGFQAFDAPPGLSRVPFTWQNAVTGRQRKMEAVGGLLGVTQDSNTLALRPQVGWAVRQAEKMDVLLGRLAVEHRVHGGAAPEKESAGGLPGEVGLPPDLTKFYHRTNGAELFDGNDGPAYRILAKDEVRRIDGGAAKGMPMVRALPPEGWNCLVELKGGGCLAINFHAENPSGVSRSDEPTFSPVCYYRGGLWRSLGASRVVALSFTELLERMLESGGRRFWEVAGFKDYGEASGYTRAE